MMVGNANAMSQIKRKCCASSSATDCPEEDLNGWSCSSAFADKTYAHYVCPFNRAVCGKAQNMDMTK